MSRSGRWIIDRLADAGWSVVRVDRDHPGWEVPPRAGVDFRAADLTDAGHRVFETTVTTTYNALVAAGQSGARVVWASSESAYGHAFAEELAFPDAFPVTEAHAMRPEDPYGVSKVAGEEVAKTVTRRYDVPAVSIRPSWIQYPGEYTCREFDDLADRAGNCWSYVDVRDVATLASGRSSARCPRTARWQEARDESVGVPELVRD